MPLNRLVVLLTPLVFAPVAGLVAAWLARHGIGVTKEDVTPVFIAGATIAFAAAAHWLRGWQKWEELTGGLGDAMDQLHPAEEYVPDTPPR